MIRVFLSASVPLPGRDERFLKTVDVIAVRDAIKGLVEVVVQNGMLVFGGHPAITPMMAALMRSYGNSAKKKVVLYQSEYFARKLPPDNDDFIDVRLIPARPRSRKRSLYEMRKRMIEETAFDAAVFIGGMEGVLEEYEHFKKVHPDAHLWPIASTGAAAREIFIAEGQPQEALLLSEMTYSTLFRELVKQVGAPDPGGS
jgi:hypothetical protein